MKMSTADRSWHSLPSEAADALRPILPALAEEIIAELRAEVPEYARPLQGPFGIAVRGGVETALAIFLDEIEAGGRRGARPDTYVNLGRGELRAGRSLEALLSAYRVGARVAWRRIAQEGQRAGLGPEVLYALAESIFAYIDELSAESAEGFALEQSAAATTSELRRERLARLLVRDPPPDPDAVEAAAAEAGWELPRHVATLVVTGEQPRLASRLRALGPVAGVGSELVLLVRDREAPGRFAELRRAVRGAQTAALGPALPWAAAHVSFARAAAVVDLARRGAVPTGRLLDADDHRVLLLLGADARLADELAAERLAPLDRLGASSRMKLTATLRAWLDHQGRLQQVAHALGVHPQTARYRIGRLRELLGDALDDPDGRFELQLALRARGLGAS